MIRLLSGMFPEVADVSQGTEYAFTMSANNTQATGTGGLVNSVSARTAYAGYEAWKAFEDSDNNYNHSWYATDGFTTNWLQVRFNTAQVVRRYDLKSSDYGTTYAGYTPRNWTFEGSNDGSSWTTLDTRTGEGSWTFYETRSFTFANATAYSYYRLNISDNTGSLGTSSNGNAHYTFLARMKLFN